MLNLILRGAISFRVKTVGVAVIAALLVGCSLFVYYTGGSDPFLKVKS